MNRSTDILWILLCGVGLLCGCTTTQPIKSMRPFWNLDRAKKTEPDDLEAEQAHTTQSEDDVELEIESSRELDIVRGGVIQTGHSIPTRRPSAYSSIEDELQYEPPADQPRLRRQWQQMDEGLLNQIFQIRRRFRQEVQLHKNNNRPMPGHSRLRVPGGSVIPAGQEQFTTQIIPASGQRNLTTPGTLGGPNPWGNGPGFPAVSPGSEQTEQLQPVPRRNPLQIQPGNTVSQPINPETTQQGQYAPFNRSSAVPPRQPKSTLPPTLGRKPPKTAALPAQESSKPKPSNPRPKRGNGSPLRNATIPKNFPGNPGGNRNPVLPREELPPLPVTPDDADPRSLGTQPPVPAFDPKWVLELQKVITRAEAELDELEIGTTEAERDRYLEQHVNLRLLYLMAGEGQKALRPIVGVEPEVQEFWQQMFWSMSNYFDVARIPQRTDRTTQALTQLRNAVKRLQPAAKLELHNVNFCHKIGSFGNYEKFEADEFTQGQAVLVYSEVSNFKSEPAADGQHFKTVLRSRIEIYNPGPNGGLVETFEFPATTDLCRKHRHDYFHSYEFMIPRNLTPGPKVLKLYVEDMLSRKFASYTLNFRVK